MRKKGKIILVVFDGLGVGELPDADKFSDIGANTLVNTARTVGGLELPNFEKLGLGNIVDVQGISKVSHPLGCYGKMAEKSAGKDTTSGHWEIAGYIKDRPFPTYPNGFPDDIIRRFENEIGIGVLGNKSASGTEIIKELGILHIETGKPIVYTSADSVFQIAAHIDVIPLEELYEICLKARNILIGEHEVGRVIARPFVGSHPNFTRTRDRKDFSVKPLGKTILDYLVDAGFPVKTVGKIDEIFAGRGITNLIHIKNDADGIKRTIEYAQNTETGFRFTNLIDLDMIYGHRNNPTGYAEGLKLIDGRLPDLINCLNQEDILIMTADHGCDPTTLGTDHTREYVPLLVYGKNLKKGINLGTRETFSDIACTISGYFGISASFPGSSFLTEIVL
jgi:phosphopentomutase